MRAAGAVLVGPNCLGVVDTTTGLQLSHAVLPAGDVAVLSQSGNLVLDLAGLLADRGLGVSRFVSLGNQADLGVVDFMHACVDHDGTRAVAVYAEDVVDGRAFLDAARALRDAGKPLVLLAPGTVRGGGAQRGLPHRLADQLLDGGRRRVRGRWARAAWTTRPSMADLLVALRGPRRMPGRRVAVLTDGGGHGAVAADALAAAGLETPGADGAVTAELEAALWAQATVTNPVDLAGAGEQDVASYARASRSLLASEQVDGVLLTGYFGGYSTEQSSLTEPELAAARQIADAVAAQDKPLVVQTIYPDSPRRPGAAGGGDPGAPRRRPRVRRAGRARSSAASAGLAERAAGPGAAGHRHVVRRGAGAVRRRRASPSRAAVSVDGRRRARGRARRDRASRSCSRRPGGCTSPRAAAWSSVSRTGTPRARRTTTWSPGWRRRPSPSRRWPTSPTGSS